MTVSDAARQRELPVELWYPASDAVRGQDVAPATRDAYELIPGLPSPWQEAVRDAAPQSGRYPLLLFSHGFGGHRRQSTFFCTHLASHGYVVASVDHVGNTIHDILMLMLQQAQGMKIEDTPELLEHFIAMRPADAVAMLDAVLGGADAAIAPLIDRDRIGITGHSFGGWTTLMVAAREPRIGAALPLAPAGGGSHMPVQALVEALDRTWSRVVPTTYLVAERDSLLPLYGMRELQARTPGTPRLLVLDNADHMHFCDRAAEMHEMFRSMPPPGAFAEVAKHTPPISELVDEDSGYQFVRGLGLAHFDAVLRGNEAAAALLDDAVGVMRGRGISVSA
ncbi:MAG: prolyl oligopeptidase family serine peptidase [Deltaproteobacteria bacterium]|nr:prolyl oligopeptidase family serine peptidase [Deltaproteobacteria bacterium]